MGLGYFLTEQMIYDATTGQALTDGTWVWYAYLAMSANSDHALDIQAAISSRYSYCV